MLLVILGHAIQWVLSRECFDSHIWNLIYSFHMPAFIAVSGWFSYRFKTNRGGYLSICERRFHGLIVPYVCWSLLSCLLSGNFSLEHVCRMILYPDTFFWFLWILFIICVIFVFCQWSSEKLRWDELWVVGLMCGVLFGVMVLFDVRIFGFQFLSYYFLFYTMGYCMHRFSILRIHNKIVLMGLFLLWCFLAWHWNMHSLPDWMPQMRYVPSFLLQYVYRGITASIALLFIFSVAPILLNGSNDLNLFLKKVGAVSLGLYVCHITIIKYVVKSMKTIDPEMDGNLLIALTFIACFVLSFAIISLLKRNKQLAKYLLGKI